MSDHLGEHRVVVGRHAITRGHTRVDTGISGLAPQGDLASGGEVAAQGILGVDARLHSVAAQHDVLLAQPQWLTRRDKQLLLHEVEAGDLLGHRVLHLQSRVHLEEGELAGPGRRHDVLDGARIDVADTAGQSHGRITQELPRRIVEQSGRRFLDDLLMAALESALALAEVDDMPLRITEHLHLDVAWSVDEPLDEEAIVAEGCQGLASRTGDGRLDVLPAADDAHALATAAGSRLEQGRPADLLDRGGHGSVVHPRVMSSRHHRHTGGDRCLLGRDLVAHRLDDLRPGSDEDQSCFRTGTRKGRILGEESIAGVHSLRS